MTHPLVETFGLLLPVFRDALVLGYSDVDVFDMDAEDYASGPAVVLGNARASMERDRFATPTRLPFRELWELEVTITAGNRDLRKAEIRSYILNVADVLVTAIANNPTLSGQVPGRSPLIRCFPQNLETRLEENVLIGLLTLSCEYRVNRRE